MKRDIAALYTELIARWYPTAGPRTKALVDKCSPEDMRPEHRLAWLQTAWQLIKDGDGQ